MNTIFTYIITTIITTYLTGMMVVLTLHVRHTGFYSPKRVSPRPSRTQGINSQPMKWPYKWWQRPIAVFIDCLAWPYSLFGRMAAKRLRVLLRDRSPR